MYKGLIQNSRGNFPVGLISFPESIQKLKRVGIWMLLKIFYHNIIDSSCLITQTSCIYTV